MSLVDPPNVDRFKRIGNLVFWLLVFIGLLVFVVKADFQCKHEVNTVDFWENKYRQMPGYASRIEGKEVTVVSKDKNVTNVLVLTMDANTDPSNPPLKGKGYMFGYCKDCHYMFVYRTIK